MSEPVDKAMAEGKAAASEGKPLSNNPYLVGSKERAAWTMGYNSITRLAEEV